MRQVIFATLVTSLLPTGAYADACMDAAADQASMTICAQKAYQAADAELNRQFHEIRQRLADDAQTRGLLSITERAWVAFRDAECAFAASATEGGSAYPMVQDLCLADLTLRRSEQLKTYLACEEGDMNCPVPPTN